MKKVNLSEIIGDSCANSFALAFRSMFCTVSIPNKNQATALISEYLKEYIEVMLPYFDENKINEYCFVTDTILKKEEIIKDKIKKACMDSGNVDEKELIRLLEEKSSLSDTTELFNSGMYNLGMILSFIDQSIQIDEELLCANSIGEYSNGDLLLAQKMSNLSIIHLGISSYIIELHQRNQQFHWNQHYNVAPNMQHIIKNQRKYQCCKKHFVKTNPKVNIKEECFLSDILLIIDLYRVKQQCILEKFMISLLFIVGSPEYEEWMQQYAYAILDILNEIMFCGEIHRVYLQEGYYNTMSDSEKTSRDATTRMSIIFSAGNDDIYIVRVDLPHKGEKFFHMNMEEVAGEKILPTGYPMTYEEFNQLKSKFDKKLLDKFFFEMDGKIWFKTKFETILKHENIAEELRGELKELFHRQAHIPITINIQEENRCESQITFVNEVKKYLKRLSISGSNCLSFGKDDIPYSREIQKVRSLFQLEERIMELISKRGDITVKEEEAFSEIEKYMGIDMDTKNNGVSIVELSETLEAFMLPKK